MKTTYKIYILCLFVCLFSGCGILHPLNKTKRKTKTFINIDTTFAIKGKPVTSNFLPLENILCFDTLKIETDRNEIKVFYSKADSTTNEPEKINITNKEKDIFVPIKAKQKITEVTKENISSTNQNRISFSDKLKILAFGIFSLFMFTLFKKLKK